MSSATLTPLQQKFTLSAKKKTKKRTVRNILASPFSNYWPLIKAKEADVLIDTLKEHLVKLRLPKATVPWSELKNVPREKRKEFRLSYNKTDSESPDKSYSSHVVFGANEATKLLETNSASSILISKHVDPKFMVKHILDMAVLCGTPILIIPNLNTVLKELSGIESIAIAFKINPNMATNYSLIDKKIKEIALDYPPPPNHINIHRDEDGYEHEEDSCTATIKNSVVHIKEDSNDEPPQNVYLYRKSKSEKTFVPALSKEASVASTDKMEVDSSGFLAFESEPRDSVKDSSRNYVSEKSKPKTKVSYKSLIIKRVTNNKDRDQKKIEMLKRKR